MSEQSEHELKEILRTEMEREYLAEIGQKRKYYDDVTYQINREDHLVNNRIGWTLQLNGFLFAAYALIGSEMDKNIADRLILILPITGIAASTACLAGAIAAFIAMKEIIDGWTDKEQTQWPRPYGGKLSFYLGEAPTVLLPAALVGVWAYLLVVL